MPHGNGKPILCLDFDGVIHDYLHVWKNGGEIYGHLTAGFMDWAERAQLYFRLVVYSSRSADPDGIENMKRWLAKECGGVVPHFLEFARVKPPAFITIDDRAVTFNGSWEDPVLDPAVLRSFKPWMQRNANPVDGRQEDAEPAGQAGLAVPSGQDPGLQLEALADGRTASAGADLGGAEPLAAATTEKENASEVRSTA